MATERVIALLVAQRENLRTVSDALFDDLRAQMREGATMAEVDGLVRAHGGVVDAINALSRALQEAEATPEARKTGADDG
jgi:hypothetical protein